MYGRSNTGKTTLACDGGFPTPVLLLDVNDQGDDSVEGIVGVTVLDIKTWKDVERVYWALFKSGCKFKDSTGTLRRAKTIVIDTASQMQRLAVEEVTGEEADTAGQWGSMTKKEWGQVASMMKAWLTRYRDLPCEVVFIAQDRATTGDEDEDKSIDPSVGPALSPAVASHLNASVHVIGNTFIRRHTQMVKVKVGKKGVKTVQKTVTQYCLRVGPNPVYVTKLRKPKHRVPPSVLVEPTYGKLINLLTGVENKP